jgi:multiple sugar transport system substrate-binding protein
MLAAAGYTSPPKTMTELAEMAKKLNMRNADGTIKVAGFVPNFGFYENTPQTWGPSWGTKWLDDQGKSEIGSDPGWQDLANFQKSLVDWYGLSNLTKFTTGAGQEFSADNAFEKGKIAMMIDGEYRTAFIAADKSPIEYGTAPFPSADNHTDLYGGGYITGNVIGISKGAKNLNASWELIKYLSFDKGAQIKLANGLKNVPSLKSALDAPELTGDPNFAPFLKIATDPHSTTTPASQAGADGYKAALQDYLVKYQESKGGDLANGLKAVDAQINKTLQLGAP